MKKFFIITSLLALTIAPATLAIERTPATVSPSGTTVTIPDIAIEKAGPLEIITIIHYKKESAKPTSPGGGKPDKAGTNSCYGFISGLAKLTETADIKINPINNSNLTENEIVTTIQTSANTWDNETATNIFGSLAVDYNANFDSIADNINEISFGQYDQNVIGVTRIWGYFSGKPSSRFIDQFDMLLNTDYQWGDANLDSNLMDLENIVTHELGHALGLGDIYTTECTDVTMFGYSTNGETSKRTLEIPDINGLETLYGI